MRVLRIFVLLSISLFGQSIGVHYLPAVVDSNKQLTDELMYDWGVEVNPASILAGSANNSFTLSAGVMVYSIDRNAEIAFPIMYYKELEGTERNHTFILDLCYRRFVTEFQKGFYVNASLRIASFSERDMNYYIVPASGEWINYNTEQNLMKIGIAFGIGYRLITRKGFMWGISISLGRYFNHLDKHSSANEFSFPVFVSDKLYFDMELLKIGWAF